MRCDHRGRRTQTSRARSRSQWPAIREQGEPRAGCDSHDLAPRAFRGPAPRVRRKKCQEVCVRLRSWLAWGVVQPMIRQDPGSAEVGTGELTGVDVMTKNLVSRRQILRAGALGGLSLAAIPGMVASRVDA